jgi:hypothetical protein
MNLAISQWLAQKSSSRGVDLGDLKTKSFCIVKSAWRSIRSLLTNNQLRDLAAASPYAVI